MSFILANKTDCTGCSACFAACSMNAISMVADKDTGFFYPEINKKLCISCGACNKVCPIYKKHLNIVETSCGYALWDNEGSKRKEGSSGGVFGRLAENVINKGGIVFGAAFKDGVHSLECLNTDEISLCFLKKSKYVECNMNDAIKRMSEALMKNRWVLFCGTPCEAMGVRSYFGEKFPKLIIVDFLCHGVPSQKAYDKYVKDTERHFGSKIESVSFRSKKLGWKTYCMYIKFVNGKEYLKPGIEDPFFRMYFRNYSYRQSCYSCNRVRQSEADLTLGDFWGVTKLPYFKDTDEGISLALVHTAKGGEILETILPTMHSQVLNKSEYEYVFDERNNENIVSIDYDTFDYYDNDILKKLDVKTRIKSFLFSRNISRRFIYRK